MYVYVNIYLFKKEQKHIANVTFFKKIMGKGDFYLPLNKTKRLLKFLKPVYILGFLVCLKN